MTDAPVKRGPGRPKKVTPKKAKPKRRTGRKPAAVNNRTIAQMKKEALAAYYEYGTVCRACKVAKVSRSTWWSWKQKDEKFREDVDNTALDIADDLEEEAIKRAKNDSDTMLIFLLKGQKPEKYSDRLRAELTGKDGGPIRIDDLTLEERMLKRKEIDAEIKRRGLLSSDSGE